MNLLMDKLADRNKTNFSSPALTPSTNSSPSFENENDSDDMENSKTKRKCDSDGDLEEQSKRRRTEASVNNAQEVIETRTNEIATHQRESQLQQNHESENDALLRKNLEKSLKDPRIKRKFEGFAKSTLISDPEPQAQPDQSAVSSNEDITNEKREFQSLQISKFLQNISNEVKESSASAPKCDKTVASTSSSNDLLKTTSSSFDTENVHLSSANKRTIDKQVPSWHGDSKEAFENLLKMHETQLSKLSFHNPNW
jgi:hypothetical protein